MTKNLTVTSPFEPAGSQPKAIKTLVNGLNDGLLHQVLLGVTGSGKTYTMAKIIESTQRPAVVMAPNKTLAAQLYGELKDFFPNNSVNILFLIMIIISLRLMSLPQILTLQKMHPLMSILSKCAFPQPKLCLKEMTRSLLLLYQPYMV